MSQQFEKLKKLLAELFQFDHADLDFGIYRVMNTKREEISRFLNEDLLPQVKEILKDLHSDKRKALEKELKEAEEQAKALGVDPENVPRVKEIKAKLCEMPDAYAVEEEVYSHLYTFFSRYYDEGDFISKRRYKENVYAIPYHGEEVKLYWANYDQYYIKTSEYFRNYAFRLPSGRRVRFEVVQAEADRDNIKTTNSKKRRFVLHEADPIAEGTDELVIRFEYRPDDRKQEEINKAIAEFVFNFLDSPSSREGDRGRGSSREAWKVDLQKPCPTSKNKDRTLLEKHLSAFTARNTFDYFIHKDLGGFLRRELDFYIKNEVVHLDDIENESAPRVEQYLAKVKAIRRIGHKIIDFLAQLENFQKKLWLKKKFIWETQYCITLDRIFSIPDEEKRNWLIERILENQDQIEEWKKLYHLHEIKGDLVRPGWSEPPTIEFLKAHPHLVVDTRHFDEEFKLKLISSFDNLDKELDGLLVHGENFQALNLLLERYRGQVKCIYIDPPYNTGDSEILYKNEYKHSSWLTLLKNRLALSLKYMNKAPVFFIAIDDYEMAHLCEMIDTIFPQLRREMIIVNHHPQGGKAKILASTHEYMVVLIPWESNLTLTGRIIKNGKEYRPFKRSGTAESNFRYARPNSFYAILVDEKTKKVVGIEHPPKLGEKYPREKTKEGFLRIYPLGNNGEERVWRRSYESCLDLITNNKLICSENYTIYQIIEPEERRPALFSNWVDPRYNAGTYGANLLRDIIGEQNPFSYPKSIYTVEDAIYAATYGEFSFIVLDYFAGSGTTAHAVINLNREDGGRRKYILVEVADYFDTVLLPRIKKVVYSRDWKDGKPKPDKDGSLNGISHFLKYIRLESYEDTLNNLELKRTEIQQKALYENREFREDYILRYMLEFEIRESLLKVKRFEDPFNYEMEIATTTVGDTRRVKVDMVETFNYLIGLRVKTVDHIRGVRVVTGESPQGEKVLILWRNTKEIDAEKLNEWFKKLGYNTKDQEFDIIYVNGDNFLENLRRKDHTWKVRLIEEEFLKRMFEVRDVQNW